jgi:hypothetical protein
MQHSTPTIPAQARQYATITANILFDTHAQLGNRWYDWGKTNEAVC